MLFNLQCQQISELEMSKEPLTGYYSRISPIILWDMYTARPSSLSPKRPLVSPTFYPSDSYTLATTVLMNKFTFLPGGAWFIYETNWPPVTFSFFIFVYATFFPSLQVARALFTLRGPLFRDYRKFETMCSFVKSLLAWSVAHFKCN